MGKKSYLECNGTNRTKRHVVALLCLALTLVLSAFPAEAARSFLRILHVNDLHGFTEPRMQPETNELLGGIGFLSARIEVLRAEKPSLLLAAGDMLQGSAMANLTMGESVIEIMNTMKFDAMVVGNHEFDFGIDVLKRRIEEATFPVLGANVKKFPTVAPYIIREIDGVKVAILGITNNQAVLLHYPGEERIEIGPPETAVSSYFHELKRKSDVLILLTHLGFPSDRDLAEKSGPLDIIIGGHSHTALHSPVVVRNTVILQAWEHGKALGVLDMELEEGRVVSCTARLEKIGPAIGREDGRIVEIVEKYERKMSRVLDEKVGETLVTLETERIRKEETNLGNFVADVMRLTVAADVAMMNSGGIRRHIPKGEIKIRDLYDALPFENHIVKVNLTGRKIREALEHGVSAVEAGAGRFPQVSGMRFTYRGSAPAGKRIRDVRIGDAEISDETEYKVAINDFMAAGGDGYKIFQEAPASVRSQETSEVGGILLRYAVIGYLKEKKIINPAVEGRIKVLP